MPIFRALVQVVVRTLAASVVGAAAVALAMLSGVVGGSSESLMVGASFVVLFGIGWSLLPIVRESRLVALVVLALWAYLGFFLSQFGEPHVRGWVVEPWLWASCALVACLLFRPPPYIRQLAKTVSASTSHGDGNG
jgi:hypothetical protein